MHAISVRRILMHSKNQKKQNTASVNIIKHTTEKLFPFVFQHALHTHTHTHSLTFTDKSHIEHIPIRPRSPSRAASARRAPAARPRSARPPACRTRESVPCVPEAFGALGATGAATGSKRQQNLSNMYAKQNQLLCQYALWLAERKACGHALVVWLQRV
jgi:hypothetical protein